METVKWHELSHQTRCVITIDSEPNYVRSMLDQAVITLSESQIEQIEYSLRTQESEVAKQIIYDQFLDCIFDSLD
ncbi:MAG: hypothetical protein CML33_09420 [Rhodobacteraceae bacterium]|jgi:hypothetical protein|nr:hypothetical protein [Paracoccaceae bacterium]